MIVPSCDRDEDLKLGVSATAALLALKTEGATGGGWRFDGTAPRRPASPNFPLECRNSDVGS
jgi:hypothetical protein